MEHTNLIVTMGSLAGHLAMWVYRQHPYSSVAGVDEVTAVLREKAADWDGTIGDCQMRRFKDWRALERWLRDAVGEHPQMTAWNTPRVDAGAEIHFVSRCSVSNPETDFIDIDALLRNVARDAWRESEREQDFSDKFDREHGPPDAPQPA